jgi:hypothetical protein
MKAHRNLYKASLVIFIIGFIFTATSGATFAIDPGGTVKQPISPDQVKQTLFPTLPDLTITLKGPSTWNPHDRDVTIVIKNEGAGLAKLNSPCFHIYMDTNLLKKKDGGSNSAAWSSSLSFGLFAESNLDLMCRS